MARVPLSIVPDNPSIPATPPDDYQHIQTSPASFGGLIGQAQEKAGAETQQAGDKLGQVAEINQDRSNKLANTGAINEYQHGVLNITGGDPSKPGDVGYFGKMGSSATYGYDAAANQVDGLRTKIRDGLQNDAQRILFDQDSRRYQWQTMEAMRSHYVQQFKSYAGGLNSATQDIQDRDAAQYYNDDQRFFNAAATKAHAAVSGVQDHYGDDADPKLKQDGVQRALSGIIKSRFDAWMGNDPSGAANWLQNGQMPNPFGAGMVSVKSQLDGPTLDNLARQGRAIHDQMSGSQAGTRAFGRVLGQNSGPIAAPDLPTEARTFLPALSGGEGNYNSPAPRGDTSGNPIQNNRYQFLRRTWNAEAPKAGVDPAIIDQPPSSERNAAQDKVAWNYARNTYKANTGQDLQTDISQGGHEPTIALALNKVWTSLPGGAEQGKPTGLPLETWVARMRTAAIPATNNARQPLSGDQILAGEAAIDNDPALTTPQAKQAAHAAYVQHVSTFHQAIQADALNAMNDYGPKIALNPNSVTPDQIWNDPRLNYAEKTTLSRQLTVEQSGKRDGDGSQFSTIFQQSNLPIGDARRVNSITDLIPHMGDGLTFSGLEKMTKWLGQRDKPEGEVQKAALAGWRKQIEGIPGGVVSPGPVSTAQWGQFLGAALPLIEGQRGKKPMAEIVGPNGDIAKLVSHYLLTPDQYAANLGVPATGATTAPALAQPTPNAAAPPPALRAGAYYIPGPNRTFVESPAGTPFARRYNGGPVFAPGGWDAQGAVVPQAPR